MKEFSDEQIFLENLEHQMMIVQNDKENLEQSKFELQEMLYELYELTDQREFVLNGEKVKLVKKNTIPKLVCV